MADQDAQGIWTKALVAGRGFIEVWASYVPGAAIPWSGSISADGEWTVGLVLGRGVLDVFVPYDPAEVATTRYGLLSKAKAANSLGRSRSWVESRIREGALETVKQGSKTYVRAVSVQRMIREAGVPPPKKQMYDALVAAGNHPMADALFREMQRDEIQRRNPEKP
jgi:hypothetical protein